MKHNLKTQEGRIAAIDELETNYIKELRKISDNFSKYSKASISENSLQIFVKVDEKFLFASEVNVYPKDKTINYPASGEFSIDNEASVARTIHAAEILKNWDAVMELSLNYCEKYKALVKAIEEANP